MGVVRVYKKQSANGKLTVYLGSRDFGDHGSFCDQVEGIVIVSPDYLKGRKVFGQIITTFRYGREEDEVMGLHFSRQLYLASEQVVPPRVSPADMIVTKLQDKLLKRFGETAYPFTFDLPTNAPPSVTLQPGTEDRGPPLGVDYELRLFVADNELDKPSKRSTIGMAIRKLQYSLPAPTKRQPSAIVSKGEKQRVVLTDRRPDLLFSSNASLFTNRQSGFMLSPGKLTLELSLDREQYFHGEKILASVVVTNHSKKTVRSVKVSVVQHTEVTLVSGHYSKTVASVELREGCPISPGTSYAKEFILAPSATENKDRRGIALDGMLKETDSNLATSTKNTSSETIGIIISYVVRARLYMGAIGGDLHADVPFTFARLEPGAATEVGSTNEDLLQKKQQILSTQRRLRKQMTREMSADLVFEDFARMRQESQEQSLPE